MSQFGWTYLGMLGEVVIGGAYEAVRLYRHDVCGNTVDDDARKRHEAVCIVVAEKTVEE